MDSEYAEAVDLQPCPDCGRKFRPDVLVKHAKVCKKVFGRKRKAFDSTKARNAGTDAAAFVSKASDVKQDPPKKKNSNWRTKHEQFQATIKAARQADAVIKAGGNLADLPPPPPDENPDYVQCPHCERRFNEGAAERHIPHCAAKSQSRGRGKSRGRGRARGGRRGRGRRPGGGRSRGTGHTGGGANAETKGENAVAKAGVNPSDRGRGRGRARGRGAGRARARGRARGRAGVNADPEIEIFAPKKKPPEYEASAQPDATAPPAREGAPSTSESYEQYDDVDSGASEETAPPKKINIDVHIHKDASSFSRAPSDEDRPARIQPSTVPSNSPGAAQKRDSSASWEEDARKKELERANRLFEREQDARAGGNAGGNAGGKGRLPKPSLLDVDQEFETFMNEPLSPDPVGHHVVLNSALGSEGDDDEFFELVSDVSVEERSNRHYFNYERPPTSKDSAASKERWLYDESGTSRGSQRSLGEDRGPPRRHAAKAPMRRDAAVRRDNRPRPLAGLDEMAIDEIYGPTRIPLPSYMAPPPPRPQARPQQTKAPPRAFQATRGGRGRGRGKRQLRGFYDRPPV